MTRKTTYINDMQYTQLKSSSQNCRSTIMIMYHIRVDTVCTYCLYGILIYYKLMNYYTAILDYLYKYIQLANHVYVINMHVRTCRLCPILTWSMHDIIHTHVYVVSSSGAIYLSRAKGPRGLNRLYTGHGYEFYSWPFYHTIPSSYIYVCLCGNALL